MQGVLLEPLISDSKQWFAGLDRFASEPFLAKGRKQPATPRREIFECNCLLDTNACIAVINGKPESVRVHLQKAFMGGATVWVPSVAAFELWYGVAKSSREELNRGRLGTFLAGPISILSFEEGTPRWPARFEPPWKPLVGRPAPTTC